jgi:cytochrome c553
MGAAGAPFPRLAGLPVEYLTKQLFDYRDDSRANAIMVPIAKALTDADIASLAWHYASLRVPAEAPAAAAPQRGRPLARYGDNALAIPACVDCHGGDVSGGGPVLPGLAQPAAYTAAQLDAFRTGERKNDGDGIMQAIAKRLSDADVKALGEYYGTMPQLCGTRTGGLRRGNAGVRKTTLLRFCIQLEDGNLGSG